MESQKAAPRKGARNGGHTIMGVTPKQGAHQIGGDPRAKAKEQLSTGEDAQKSKKPPQDTKDKRKRANPKALPEGKNRTEPTQEERKKKGGGDRPKRGGPGPRSHPRSEGTTGGA
ncbi:unnamed protein product [Calypogeia fissa]